MASSRWWSAANTSARIRLCSENRVQRPAGHISCGGGHLEAADAGSGGDQDVHDVGHAEHRSMLQRGGAGHAAGVGCGDSVDVSSGLDQYLGDLGVAVAGGGDQRSFRVSGAPVHGRASVDQGFGDGAGAGQLGWQPEPVVVESQHGHVAERVSSELVVAPVLHLGGGELGVIGQQAGEPGRVAAVEDLAAFDFEFELGPAGEPVLAGQRQLRRGQDDPAGDRAEARGCFRVTALGAAQQFPGLVAELVEVGPGRQIRHDVSLVTRWSAAGPERSVICNGLLPLAEVDSVLPADPAAPSSACAIVSPRASPGTVADRSRIADPNGQVSRSG
jgi:hypothetical protein